MNCTRFHLPSFALLLSMALTACSLGSTDVTVAGMPAPAAPGSPDTEVPLGQPEPGAPTEPATPAPAPRCDVGKSYVGFAGTQLAAGRVDNDLGLERARLKPYVALQGEYQRVLGNNPALLAQAGSTFGQDPARWLTEPQSSAVSLYTAYRVAFQGCLTATATDAKYGVLPSNSTAEAECRSWARKFWSKDVVPGEVDACVKVAMVDTVKEGSADTTTRRRWAYTCASVLSAAGFMTY